YGWNDVNRGSGVEDEDANIFGLFNAIDFAKTTVRIDAAVVTSQEATIPGATSSVPARVTGGDSVHLGAVAIQRIGLLNSSFRVNASLANDQETEDIGEGVLFFSELSRTLPHSVDLVYGTAFYALDNYTAIRRRVVQGPLAPAGILFEGAGLGFGGSVLPNAARDVIGGAIGHQKFWDNARTHLIIEAAARVDTSGDAGAQDALGIGARIQHGLSSRMFVRLDGGIANMSEDDTRYTIRAGMAYQL
ncbi:MAG: hypothetical protein O3C57_05430, partial [Verrucomicrobia bacterium]|nr:hypothetical protein [Verrucomicrobiota bacterium]